MPAAKDLAEIANFFGLVTQPANAQIVHSLSTTVIGADGKVQQWFDSNDWKPAEVAQIDQNGEHVSVRNLAHQSHGLLFSGTHRATDFESHHRTPGMAHGHRRGFFFGGYTTFSSFGWETAKMFEAGEWLRASTYVAASVVLGLLLSVAGIRLANRF